MCGVYPDADTRVAGTEVSSTYEGRHLTFLESELTHPTHADDFVDKGDPVVVGAQIVGVAFKSAAAATDLIAIDTEGIWVQSVVAYNDFGPSAVAAGDQLYINRTTCEISKRSNETTHSPFGYALGAIGDGSTATIAVKVHFDPVVHADDWVDKIFYGTTRFEGSISIEPGNALTVDNVTTRIIQGITGLTVSDHPTFDYITLTTIQGVTGLTPTDYPTFHHATLGYLVLNGQADYPLDMRGVTPNVADIALNNDQVIRNAHCVSRAAARALMGDACPLGSIVIGDDGRATTKPDVYIKVLAGGADSDWERIVTQASD